jgi:hypothetical protein
VLTSLWGSALAHVVEELVVTTTTLRRRSSLDEMMGRPVEERGLPRGNCLPRCRRLSLAGTHLHDIEGYDGVVDSPLSALAEWDHLRRLEVLDLSYCYLQGSAIQVLASLDLPAIRVLRL